MSDPRPHHVSVAGKINSDPNFLHSNFLLSS